MKKPKKDNQLLIVVLLLAVVTIAAYLPVLRADYVNFDDQSYVTLNPYVQSGLTAEEFKWAFNVGYSGNWHPLTWISHMLDRQMFGPGPAAPHAVNLLLHLANTLLLLFVLNRITKSLWKSAIVAALFAVHPTHVESVAWISERKDVLSTLFWMLTMWAYVRYTESPNLKRNAVMLVFFALGLMSKPTLVTLPLVFLLLDYWPLGRWSVSPWRLVKEKLPLFALSVASCVVTYQAHQGTVAATTLLPISSRITNALAAYLDYIGMMLWPAKLAVFYPHPASLPIWHVMAAVVVLVAVTALVMRSARSRPYLVVGWLWYLIVLAPMIGLVQVGSQSMADRYTYVSFIGLFIMIAWGVGESIRLRTSYSGQVGVWECGGAGVSELAGVTKSKRRKRMQEPQRPAYTWSSVLPVVVASSMLIAALAVGTWRQAGYWRDSLTLWSHAQSVTTSNALAHAGLGTALYGIGQFGEAASEYEQAVRIEPNFAEAYGGLGATYSALGMYNEAANSFEQTVRIDPSRANAYFGLGDAYGKLGRYSKAADAYKQVIRLNPNDADAHFNVGLAYVLLGNKTLAAQEYKILEKLNPQMANRLFNIIYK